MDDYENYWTGLADFISSEMPTNAIGVIARVVTFAPTLEDFECKVHDIEENSGGKLIVIEEPYRISDFFKQKLDKSHEVYELFETAKKNVNDVVFGDYEYYTQNDA